MAKAHPPSTLALSPDHAGAWFVLAAAVVWSLGGTFGRLLGSVDGWTVVFWRSVWAAAFLTAFMLVRDGARGSCARFAAMGIPGIAVGLCLATASTAFVIALGHTTVANVLLVQAGVPLIAGLMAWAFLGERMAPATWVAIAAVLAGVTVMVAPSLTGATNPTGDALAVVVACAFAGATVITRRHAQVRMTPAVTLGALLAATFAGLQAPGLGVTPGEMTLLFGFGALNFGLGLALFVTGAPRVPAAVAGLIGVTETVLGPIWVWLFLGEVPGALTLVGGGIVLAALAMHIGHQLARSRHPRQA